MRKLLLPLLGLLLPIFVGCEKVCECTTTIVYSGHITEYFEDVTFVSVESIKSGSCADLNDRSQIFMDLSTIEEEIVCVRL